MTSPSTVNGIPWWEAGELPAIPPPPGSTPNFVNPKSLHPFNVLTQSVCLTIATLLMAMRMYTKLRILKTAGWDDYSGVLAYLGLIAYACISLKQDGYGNGRHLWNVKGKDFVQYAKLVWVFEIIYNPIIFLTKLSIFLLYLRVFNPIMRTSITLHVVLWANFTFYLSAIFVEAFQCNPVQKAWYPLWPGHCVNQQAAQMASAVINSISDIIILLLPVGSIWSLKVHRKGKIGLFVIFSFGIFGCVASISRAVLFGVYGRVHTSADGTWIYYPLNLLSAAEITCGLVCSCLPALPAFCRHVSGFKIQIIVSTRNNRKPIKIGSNNIASSSMGNSARSNARSPFPPFSPHSPAGGKALESIGGRPLPPLPIDQGSPAMKMHQWPSPDHFLRSPRTVQREQYDELDDLEYVKGDESRSPPTTPSRDGDEDLEQGGKLAKMGFASRR